MIRVVVASRNPVKLRAAAEGFQRMFGPCPVEIQGVNAPSGVRDQPMSDAETLQGAFQRAQNARQMAPDADYWVGIEGGIEDEGGHEQTAGGHEQTAGGHQQTAGGQTQPAGGQQPANGGSNLPWTAGGMKAFAWVVVLSCKQVGRGRTGTFFLPPRVAELVRAGKELGEADDIVFGRSNSKQENGAVGLLTGDVIDRAAFYEHAVILALTPFKNPNLY